MKRILVAMALLTLAIGVGACGGSHAVTTHQPTAAESKAIAEVACKTGAVGGMEVPREQRVGFCQSAGMKVPVAADRLEEVATKEAATKAADAQAREAAEHTTPREEPATQAAPPAKSERQELEESQGMKEIEKATGESYHEACEKSSNGTSPNC